MFYDLKFSFPVFVSDYRCSPRVTALKNFFSASSTRTMTTGCLIRLHGLVGSLESIVGSQCYNSKRKVGYAYSYAGLPTTDSRLPTIARYQLENLALYCNLYLPLVVLCFVMNTGSTDSEIISRVLRGEQQAFAELVNRYQNFVFTITLRYTDNREDAEEIAQDIFVKAYRSLADFRGASKFSTWLYTIVTTSCITFLRKKKLETRSLDDERVFEQADNQNSGFTANQVEQKSKVAMVNEAIKLLSPDDAKIITLFYKGEQSLEEIGVIIGMEPNTVKVKLHRARQRLKEKMEKYFPQEVADTNWN